LLFVQLKENTLVNTTVMWRKLLIIHLLMVLALLPVAQAMSPIAGSPEAGQMSHELMNMDCGQMDSRHCVDFEICTSAGHASCDSKTKSTLVLPALMKNNDTHVYNNQPLNQYFSHRAKPLLRPPRNA
jgi:hypothetical protein